MFDLNESILSSGLDGRHGATEDTMKESFSLT